MRALANDGQPRFRLPCAEVLLPSCGCPVAAPRLRRQVLVLLFGAAVTGCAGPRPQLRPQDQTGSHRTELGIAQRLPEVRLVQRARVISPLPDVSVRLVSRIPVGSVPPVGLLQCLCQTIDFVRNRDQVDMVRHEAISNEGDAVEDDVLAQQLEVDCSIGVAVQDEVPPVATLRTWCGTSTATTRVNRPMPGNDIGNHFGVPQVLRR
jgi:hypothetical protein